MPGSVANPGDRRVANGHLLREYRSAAAMRHSNSVKPDGSGTLASCLGE